jgi:glycosyltransferase involved in cell wall biosynthesis
MLVGRSAVDVVIPALDEREAIGLVLAALPPGVRRVIVVDNGSTDGTGEVARAAGAHVVREPRRGYGRACLTGLAELGRLGPPDVVAFLDADYSDHPEELRQLVEPIVEDRADLVVGSRMLRPDSRRALTPQARFGNRLAAFLLRRLYGLEATDLGPFRAVRWTTLARLGMRDTGFGWTVEMQAKAALARARYAEVAVSYRPRIGRSKISGTLVGSIRAGTKILWCLARLRGTAAPTRT